MLPNWYGVFQPLGGLFKVVAFIVFWSSKRKYIAYINHINARHICTQELI